MFGRKARRIVELELDLSVARELIAVRTMSLEDSAVKIVER